MPRLKTKTPKKLGDSEEPVTKKKLIDNSTRRRRVLSSALPGTLLLGSQPLRCLWDGQLKGPPKVVTWTICSNGDLEIFADGVRIFPKLAVLSHILLGQRKLYELIYCQSDESNLLLDIAIPVLPWPNATSVVETLFNRDYSEVSDVPEEVSSEAAWEGFFNDLRRAQSSRPRAALAEYQHPDLTSVLRGYQADAVQWMVEREGTEVSLDLGWLTDVADAVPVRGGPPLLYNKYSKTLTERLECPTVSKGGILADEMGLGKTVITLALVLKNKRHEILKESAQETDDSTVVKVSCSSSGVAKKNVRRLTTISDEDEDWQAPEICQGKNSDDDTSQETDDSTVVKVSCSSSGVAKKNVRRLTTISDEDEDWQAPEICQGKNSDDDTSNNRNEEKVAQKSKKGRRKRRRIRYPSDSSDDEPLIKTQRMKNQEGNLNADEELQLVPSRPEGGTLRSHLNAWYESKLAELSCTRVRYTRERYSEKKFRCTCGAEVDDIPRDAVSCPECNLYQHASCVGYSSDYDYLCPACWKNAPRIESSATLIVAPPAIYDQWGSEIEHHAPGLKLSLYNGVSRSNFIQPSHLAEYDVVVTTYSVLSSETLLIQELSERRLRADSRFLRQSCPLTCISWWRVVCDEAQLVESDVSRVCQMMQQLSAEHRWSVTGTPIQRSISDLFYLTQFIGLGPLDDKATWVNFLLKPYLAGYKKPMISVLNQVFWRSTKDSVSDELGLPEQSFRRHFLSFSPIEQTFYMQEHKNCSYNFAEGISKLGIASSRTLDSINKSTLNKLLKPLLRIRQACTHPQVVRGVTIGSVTGTANQSELLTYLSRKAKGDCEEALRHHIGALNGIAGLHCLRFEWLEAIEKYRTVLRLYEEYREKVKVDSCQRLHALTNAADVLDNNSGVAPPTLRDGTLRSEADELEKEYLLKPAEAFQASLLEAKKFGSEVSNIRKLFESAPDAWCVHAILSVRDFEHELMDKLHIDLDTNDHKEKKTVETFLRKLTTLRSVELTVVQWWGSLEKHRKLVIKAMHLLAQKPVSTLVQPAVECHLRKEKTDLNLSKCDLCKVEQFMLDLECLLFATHRKTFREYTHKIEGIDSEEWHNKVHGNETKYSWKPHYAEKTLAIIANFGKSKQVLPQWCLNDAKFHDQLLDNMKKEFKKIRSAWKELNHLVQSKDELVMSKIRLRLPFPGEECKLVTSPLDITQPDKIAKIHVIDPHQVDQLLLTLVAEAGAYFSTFKKKHGQMLYLKRLGEEKNAAPDLCPVCKSALDRQWCVLQCGHCFCIECIQEMCRRSVSCPVCREVTEATDLCFVDSKRQAEADIDIPVLGNFSTKVDAIVRTALELLKEDPCTKILIFSSWTEVLKIVQKALNLNHVKNLLFANASSQHILQTFRDPEGQVSVLLLPLKLGSKGLNLTEATHVFLTEPILNSAEELQAIGRVHRIGQTKATVVHRFLVEGTIEEKIHSTLSEAKDKWSNKKVTLADLQNLFVVPSRVEDETS